MNLQSVTQQLVEKYVALRSQTVSATTVNIEMRTLSAAFNRAVNWNLIPANPCLKVERPRVEHPKPRALTKDEAKKLLSKSNKPLRRTIELFLRTGMRLSELLSLPWKHVDLKNREILIQPYKNESLSINFCPKTHEQRRIPIDNETIAVLGKPGDPDELVVGRNAKGYRISKNWLEQSLRRSVERAGIRKCTPQTFRRSHASAYAAIPGVTSFELCARMGWRTIAIAARYIEFAQLLKNKKRKITLGI